MLHLVCDLTIASENAIFGQPEVTLGITPGFGGTQRLMRLVGQGRARELIFSARTVKAAEALEMGLVNAVYPSEELLPAAKRLALRIARNAPIAVRACKAAMNEGMDLAMDEAVAAEVREFSGCFETEDQKRGMAGFLNKQKNIEFENR